jgi:hypothetical protein
MPIQIGILLALIIGLFATVVGLDRDRAFYPTVMIVIAVLYSLFAVIGGSTDALIIEALVGLVFIVVAVVGFKTSLWAVAIVLAGHGLFDLVHGRLVTNPGVPSFWPGFCGAYDVTAGVYLGVLLKLKRIKATA